VRFFSLLIIFNVILFGVDKQKLIDCYEIFEQKKLELEREAEKLLEEKEAFESLKNTYMVLMKKKEEALKKKELELNATLQAIEKKKKELKELIKKNQKVLEEIKNAKLDKITQSYAKMRPKNAASVLSNMEVEEALEIIQKLQPKVVAKIFAKMDPKKAAILTQKMMEDKNESTNTTNR